MPFITPKFNPSYLKRSLFSHLHSNHHLPYDSTSSEQYHNLLMPFNPLRINLPTPHFTLSSQPLHLYLLHPAIISQPQSPVPSSSHPDPQTPNLAPIHQNTASFHLSTPALHISPRIAREYITASFWCIVWQSSKRSLVTLFLKWWSEGRAALKKWRQKREKRSKQGRKKREGKNEKKEGRKTKEARKIRKEKGMKSINGRWKEKKVKNRRKERQEARKSRTEEGMKSKNGDGKKVKMKL